MHPFLIFAEIFFQRLDLNHVFLLCHLASRIRQPAISDTNLFRDTDSRAELACDKSHRNQQKHHQYAERADIGVLSAFP